MPRKEKLITLPPFETELFGKTWQEVKALSDKYRRKAQNAVVGKAVRGKKVVKRDHERESFYRTRADSLFHQATLLYAVETIKDPHAPPEKKYGAEWILFPEKIYKRVSTLVPSPPGHTALVATPRGEYVQQPVSQQDIEQYRASYEETLLGAYEKALSKIQTPDNTYMSLEEFFEKYMGHGRLIEVPSE